MLAIHSLKKQNKVKHHGIELDVSAGWTWPLAASVRPFPVLAPTITYAGGNWERALWLPSCGSQVLAACKATGVCSGPLGHSGLAPIGPLPGKGWALMVRQQQAGPVEQ